MNGKPIQKDLGTLEYTTSAEQLLSGKYYLPVGVD